MFSLADLLNCPKANESSRHGCAKGVQASVCFAERRYDDTAFRRLLRQIGRALL